jgi:hypothetical protein
MGHGRDRGTVMAWRMGGRWMQGRSDTHGTGRWRLAALGTLLLGCATGLSVAATAAGPAGAATPESGVAPASDPAAKPPQPADALAGQGLAALEFRAEAPLDFGRTTLGAASPVRVLTLVAGPSAQAKETYEVRVGGDFKGSVTRCELAAKGACAIGISFAPTRVGTTTGAVVVAAADGGPTRVAALLTGRGQDACEARGLWACSGWPAVWPVVGLCALYLVAMMYVRWNMVAVPARDQLRAEIDAVRARARSLKARSDPADGDGVDIGIVNDLLQAADRRLPLGTGWPWLMNVVFWSRGQEHMGFQLLHEAKQTLAALSPPDILRVELEEAEGRLRARNDPAALALADRLRAALDKPLLDVHDHAGAVLRETLVYLQRNAGDFVASLAAATQTGSPPAAAASAAADPAALARRVQTALSPDERHALAAATHAVLQRTHVALPPQHRVLLEYTQRVLLPAAEAARDALDKVVRQPTATADDWRAALSVYREQYLAVAMALRTRIELALAATPVEPPERWRALLREAMHNLYAAEDTAFAWTASWHKKTLWLAWLGLGLICALSATFLAHSSFFLLGALGGLLSRMQRMLTRERVAVDYGQSWITLFLSPVTGALAGWTGVLLVSVAVDWGVLGSLFAKVHWDQPDQVLTLAAALLFGISERLLMGVVEGLEKKAGGGAADQADADGKGTAGGDTQAGAAARTGKAAAGKAAATKTDTAPAAGTGDDTRQGGQARH